MDRNQAERLNKYLRDIGQARKSLWIETEIEDLIQAALKVRLVRACGSKPFLAVGFEVEGTGQARKSLWIETTDLLR